MLWCSLKIRWELEERWIYMELGKEGMTKPLCYDASVLLYVVSEVNFWSPTVISVAL
jgi:hypothetical protein